MSDSMVGVSEAVEALGHIIIVAAPRILVDSSDREVTDMTYMYLMHVITMHVLDQVTRCKHLQQYKTSTSTTTSLQLQVNKS